MTCSFRINRRQLEDTVPIWLMIVAMVAMGTISQEESAVSAIAGVVVMTAFCALGIIEQR